MAQTSGTGGLGSVAIGGIAAVAVIIGGVVLVQMGVFGGRDDDSSDTALRSTSQGSSLISPSTGESTGISVASTGETAPAADVPQTAAPDAAVQAESANQTSAAAQPTEADSSGTTEADATAQTASQDGAGGLDQMQKDASVVSLTPPQLDLVRVDPDGAVVIAGRTMPGAEVSVLLDGTVLERSAVQGNGEFVIFTSLEPSGQPRVISLLARVGDQEAASQDQFILAPATPMPAPQVAEAPALDAKGEEASSGTAAAPEPAAREQVALGDGAPATASEPAQPAEEQPGDNRAAEVTAPPVEAASQAPELAEVQTEQTGSAETAVVVETAQTQDQTQEEVAPQDAAAVAVQPAAGEASTTAEAEPAPVPQTAGVAVLRAGADGIELVQPAAPVLGGKVALDTISYSESGEVLLAGRGRAGAIVRAYVNNDLKGEMPVGADSRWDGALKGVEPGIYTLRLDEVNTADSAVLSRLETPFKREAPEVLQLPAQEPGASPDQPVPLVRAVTVQKGDTLWAISQDRYGSGFLYVRVFEANQDAIRDPDLIYPGQVFNLPE